ncbi:MAG: hypothetical protein ACN4GZ_00150 [Acidimicrobiales bacterium]
MTKSIISGLGLLAVVMAILLWLVGVYEMSPAGALATGFIGFVFAVFFARFGGFKPFFPGVEGASDGVATAEVRASGSSSSRRLVGVGAEADSSVSLFGERSPESPPTVRMEGPEVAEHGEDSDESEVPRAPLFGEALSEQLAGDRSAGEELDQAQGPVHEYVTQEPTGFVQGLRDAEQPPPAEDADSAKTSGIAVDDDPEWVGTDALDSTGHSTVDSATGDTAHDDDLVETTHDGADDDEDDLADAVLTADDQAPGRTDATREPIDGPSADAGEAATSVAVPESTDTRDDIGAELEDELDGDVDLEDLDAEELAASLDALEPTDPAESAVEVDYVAEPMVTESTGLAVASGTELPVVVETPAPLELHKYSPAEIMSVVKSQEGVLVDTLIEEGVLSTAGPITDKDIRTMVFVAVSSNELIEVLTEAQREAVALNGGGDHALGTGD